VIQMVLLKRQIKSLVLKDKENGKKIF